ncbi:Gp19/Gp15/Gp42 family protein [Mycobacterium intracellulare]|uniref:Gp19/Gp15/Gp42 family protein n=1 Tax=Mycobacterium intracellulare TaxID=1767 RepID=A0AAE4U7R3_MYCIT|nr:Gp19/Gp15/Gp42 family protein [Mycobacterium intracellulare]MDV6975333.1 Gp19/Gp15/Gp42 family protein [Mycobacterium intracellulare]MDV6980397.1 Gp19/Gp15/Gp42 family protein [Mycobacterium intracellulare]MDV7010826.1 Gp19/Gp15/Gp42 family protein [Mycobacterium intracellulare]MDV7025732.1 Gp19/Gp15/Gp42 family protein [Mycobacterium intracellulare]
MATYADAADDVVARWGKAPEDVEPEILTLINKRLGDVERMIKRRFKKLGRDLDADVTDDTVDVEDVKQVEAEAVLRLVRNPDGYLSETDGNYTYMLQNDLATGKLEILAEEWEILGVIQSRMSILIPNPVLAT